MELQAVVALIVGVIVVLFVPALVWSAVVSGLYQTIRKKVRETRRAIARKSTVSAR